MTVLDLHVAPPAELARALERFEAQFTYPLGSGRWFRIAHGDDYPRFFRAMGEAASFVAVRGENVLGTVGAALRDLHFPDGSERRVAYLGDLKVAPGARGGRVLLGLARQARAWVGARANAAFGVVMDGTRVLPKRYTGRLGVPLFHEIGRVMVLRLSTAQGGIAWDGYRAADAAGSALYRELSAGRYATLGGDPAERSESPAVWLVDPEGGACGRLEDTRKAKRLIAGDGVEMRCAHLSSFAFRDLRAGVRLLLAALRRASELGFPGLFVSVAGPEWDPVREALGGVEVLAAPATVYGAGLQPGPLWNLNTAEI